MDQLSDEDLKEVFIKAKKLDLDPLFILMIEEEIERRSLLPNSWIQEKVD